MTQVIILEDNHSTANLNNKVNDALRGLHKKGHGTSIIDVKFTMSTFEIHGLERRNYAAMIMYMDN